MCEFDMYVSKLSKYIVFLCVFVYRQLFDLYLLPIDMLVLPQELFMDIKSVNMRKSGSQPYR